MKKRPPEGERPQNKPASQLQMAPHPIWGGGDPDKGSQPPGKLHGDPALRNTHHHLYHQGPGYPPLLDCKKSAQRTKTSTKNVVPCKRDFDIAGRTIYSSFFREVDGHLDNLLNRDLYFQEKHNSHLYTKCSVYFQQVPRIYKPMDFKRECPYLGKERN